VKGGGLAACDMAAPTQIKPRSLKE